MKKLAIVCLLALGTTAFSQDLLGYAKGTWKVDVAATKKLPANKKAIAKELGDEVGAQMLKMLWSSDFVISKEGLSIVMMIEDTPMKEEFTLVEKNKKTLVLKDTRGKKVKVIRTAKGLAMRNAEKDKDGSNITTILVKKK